MNFCLICTKPVPEFVSKYCCNGIDCGCMGQLLEPCICSDRCWDALIAGIGKPYDERRRDAGIEVYLF